MPGIHDMAFHIPRIYLPIEVLAENRNIEYARLNKGLGLKAMSLADVHEDASTMAANAVKRLIDNNNLRPDEIGRIYVGSESATDASKPIASYVLAMLSMHFESIYGENAFLHTDVVDLTFACIGGVDALQNTLDWVRSDPGRKGIVVCTDNARYELGSTGEYTQGAGAVAMLVTSDPSIIEFDTTVGTATVGVHDFFKPVRRMSQRDLAAAVNGPQNGSFQAFSVPHVISANERYIDIHREYPVFDGKYSNECYASRIKEAYDHYCSQREAHHLDEWDRVVLHLPYAFHGKRFFTEIFHETYRYDPVLLEQVASLEPKMPGQPLLKVVSKTPAYRQYVKSHIEKGQRASSLIGNLYTGSIFMSLISLLEAELEEGTDITGHQIGFCSYGSGSKSKVFSGRVKPGWALRTAGFNLFRSLAERKPISFDDYEALHGGRLDESLLPPGGEFFLSAVETGGPLVGRREYRFGTTEEVTI